MSITSAAMKLRWRKRSVTGAKVIQNTDKRNGMYTVKCHLYNQSLVLIFIKIRLGKTILDLRTPQAKYLPCIIRCGNLVSEFFNYTNSAHNQIIV